MDKPDGMNLYDWVHFQAAQHRANAADRDVSMESRLEKLRRIREDEASAQECVYREEGARKSR